MDPKYCQKCGNKVLQSMRMCPACGAKDFDLTPPSSAPAPGPHVAPPPNAVPRTAAQPAAATASWPGNFGSPTALIPASIGARFVAYLIDALILAVLSAIPVAIAYLLTLPTKSQGFSLFMAIAMLVGYIVPFVYCTVLPASELRATYGKRAMGLKLLTVQGERLSKAQAFIRVLLMMIIPISGIFAITVTFGGMVAGYKDELATSLGIAWLIAIPVILFGPYITAFFNPTKQTLYDMIVKTIVVKG